MKCSKPTKKKQPVPGGPNHGGTKCVITCHNYKRFLMQCIESCVSQTLPFEQIVVVDDSSTDGPEVVFERFHMIKNLKLIRGEWADHVQARNHGVTAGRPTQFLLFVDADNWLDPEFHEKARKAMDDPQCGVAYGVLRRFDDASGEPRGNLHMSYNYNALRKENYVDTCSLVRQEAFDQAGWWRHTPDGRGLEDWALWLRITRLGWTMVRTQAMFHYRMHEKSMSATTPGTHNRRNTACLKLNTTITIVTLMAGRSWALRQQVGAIKKLDWNKANLRWLCIDNSVSTKFNRELWDTYLTGFPIPVTVAIDGEHAVRNTPAHKLADSARLRSSNVYAINVHLARMYAQARGLCAADSDFVLCLEDDILPPPHTLTEMVHALQADRLAGVVSGCVQTRFSKKGHLLAWQGHWSDTGRMDHHEHVIDAPQGNIQVTAAGFMCTLFRRQVWDAIAFRPGPLWSRSNAFYDWAAAHEVERLGWRWLLCGGVRCVHLQSDGNNLHVPITQHESINANPTTTSRPRNPGVSTRTAGWTPHARAVRTAKPSQPRR